LFIFSEDATDEPPNFNTFILMFYNEFFELYFLFSK